MTERTTMNAYAVDLARIAVLVRTEGKITRLPFRTKKQADKKILELIQSGYKFDRYLWAEWQTCQATDEEFIPTNDAEDRYNRGN